MIYKVLIFCYLILPVVLLYKKQHHALAAWIISGVFLDIFSVQLSGNISSLKITGLVLTPYLLFSYRNLVKNREIQIILVILSYLICSFIFFSFISPWENTTLFDRVNASYIRGAKQVLTNISEFSLVIYLAIYSTHIDNLKKLTQFYFLAGIICLIGIYLETILKVDFFQFFTNGRSMIIPGRARGFTFEPRAASQYMAYLTLYVLVAPYLKRKQKLIVFPFIILAFFLSMSLTGVLVLLIGILIYLALSLLYNKKVFKLVLGSSLIVTFLSIMFYLPNKKMIDTHLKYRSYPLTKSRFIEKFEYADYAALEFLSKNPMYLIFGAGTGQSVIATSKYKKAYSKNKFSKGYTYLPFMGINLDLINAGMVLIILKLLLLWRISINFLRDTTLIANEKYQLFIFSLSLCLLYFLQVRYMHIIGLATLLSASLKSHKLSLTR